MAKVIHTLTIPYRFYAGLSNRDAFCNPSPEDRAAREVFEKAERVKHGVGSSYVFTATNRGVLTYMLDYFASLLELVEDHTITASELGVRRDELAVIANRRIVSRSA